PLMAGNDLQHMTAETKAILTNQEIIALDQDTLGKQGFCFRDNGDYQIWIKKLAKDEKAACLLNKSDEVKEVQVDFNLLLKASDSYWQQDNLDLKDYVVRDLWEHKNVAVKQNPIFIKLPPHAVTVYRFIKGK
ncbi:MAG TPA: hypothetical protein VFX43_03030, partial [Chitinophagaceae bacterium]|nr:hypothetical protein [Chitinophagaceae bacterium]